MTDDSYDVLRGCFDCTDWNMFKESCGDIDEFTDTVTSYISWCEDMCSVMRRVTIYGNDKPWFTTDIKHKLMAKNAAFVSGNTDEYRKAKGDVRKAIKKAKYKYKRSLEEQFANNNTKSVWQGLRQITQYKQSVAAINNSDTSFPDQLNEFYSRFDKLNTSPEPRLLPSDISLYPPFVVDQAQVRTLFRRLNKRKAPGPDNISSSTLRNCADQLCTVFTDIFNSSLEQCRVPMCFKTSMIIPIPKKSNVSTMNKFQNS